MSQYDTTFDLKINVGHCDPYFMVQWFCLTCISKAIWYMNTILWDYESVWPDVWPQNICRTLWPIFHGPVMLPYILKTIQWLKIILWDYESVWPNIWPKKHLEITVTYILWSTEFALYLEDCLMYEHHTLGWWVSMTRKHHTLGLWVSMTRPLA